MKVLFLCTSKISFLLLNFSRLSSVNSDFFAFFFGLKLPTFLGRVGFSKPTEREETFEGGPEEGCGSEMLGSDEGNTRDGLGIEELMRLESVCFFGLVTFLSWKRKGSKVTGIRALQGN